MAIQRQKIKTIDTMVAEIIEETSETTTIVLFTGNDKLEYQPGHFLTIDPKQFEALDRWICYLEDLKGKKEKPRAYSISSAPHEKYLAFTVKEEQYVSGKTKYPPLLSPILAKRSIIGSKLTITGFTGPYVLPNNIEDIDEIVHICAGSGVVPNFSILKHTLYHFPTIKHTFVLSNKRVDDVIFKNQLMELQKQYPNCLKLVFNLTREKSSVKLENTIVRNSRITEEDLLEVNNPNINQHFMICGPAINKFDKQKAKKTGETPTPKFLETILSYLENIGIESSQITKESYG